MKYWMNFILYVNKRLLTCAIFLFFFYEFLDSIFFVVVLVGGGSLTASLWDEIYGTRLLLIMKGKTLLVILRHMKFEAGGI